MTDYWLANNIVRTGPPPAYQGGRIHPPNPEAHAKLRAYWEPRTVRRALPSDNPAVNLDATLHKRAQARARGVSMPSNRPLDDEYIRQAHALYMSGVAFEDVAAQYNISEKSLRRRCRQLDLPTNELDMLRQEIANLRARNAELELALADEQAITHSQELEIAQLEDEVKNLKSKLSVARVETDVENAMRLAVRAAGHIHTMSEAQP
jgi:hypothetical protein